VAFETPWIRVDANEVTHWVAGDSVYGTVHFKNRALGILPLSEQGDPLPDAKRELEEEAGLRARRWDRGF
jgi:hypothetical protein